METEESFYNLILNVLGMCNQSGGCGCLNENYKEIMKRAFIHKSYDPVNNNELFVTKGHIFVKYILSLFIEEEFPNITSSFQYTTIMDKFQESKNYTQIALNLKLHDHIKFNLDNCKFWTGNGHNFKETKEYLHMCSDVFIALCYALSEILHNNKVEACYEFISNCFLKLNIPVDYENTVSSITRLHELYEYLGIEINQRKKYFHTKVRDEYHDILYEKFTGNKIPKDSRTIGLGYMFDGNNIKLVSIVACKYKNEARKIVAKELLANYELLGIKLPQPKTWNDII
jgi:dsRNA-specific ribonuclease